MTTPTSEQSSREQEIALCEAHQITASDEFFAARQALDFKEMRRIYEAGYKRAWSDRPTLSGQTAESGEAGDVRVLWSDDQGATHSVSVPYAAELLKQMFDEWPDGMNEIESAMKWRDQEIERLRNLAGTCYAGLGAECNLPEPWLDALSAAANGEPFSTDGLLPFTLSTPSALPAQGEQEGCMANEATYGEAGNPVVDELTDWVVSRWHAEVKNRPLVNKNRRPLDDAWRQILRHLGVDDRARLGPTHDELMEGCK